MGCINEASLSESDRELQPREVVDKAHPAPGGGFVSPLAPTAARDGRGLNVLTLLFSFSLFLPVLCHMVVA